MDLALPPPWPGGGHPAAAFYRWQFVASAAWWLLLLRLTGRHLYDMPALRGSVVTRPTWLPAATLLALHAWRREVFVAVLLAECALGVDVLGCTALAGCRVAAACVVTCYHLLETSATHRHGEYPLLYNAWAMCIPHPAYAAAASLGIAVHFIFSSGVAKLHVGGWRWGAPSTMRLYLDVYHGSRSAGPISRTLNRWIARRAWATAGIGLGTLVLECAVIPLVALVAPAEHRGLAAALMVGMHVGIALAMSGLVGVAFFTTLPSYLVGFGFAAGGVPPAAGGPAWWLAAAVALGPTAGHVLLRRGRGAGADLLPEHWPLSPVALFMWNGAQARALAENLMTGATRVVMCTEEAAAGGAAGLAGMPVVHHGAVTPHVKARAPGGVVHDVVLRAVGFTILHGELQAAAPRSGAVPEDWDVARFVRRLQRFLRDSGRLVEARTGHPLRRAFFVRVDPSTLVVAEVLADGNPS